MAQVHSVTNTSQSFRRRKATRRTSVRCGWLVAVLTALLVPYGLAMAQESRSVDVILGEAAAAMAQRFPKVTGEVIKVEGEQVYISLGVQDNLLEGVQLAVFRAGDEITRPSTGEALGRLEDARGFVIVEEVFERYAVTRLLPPAGTGTVRAGDNVRITSGQITLGVFPVANLTGRKVPRGMLTTELQRALEATGRFRVVPANRILLWSYENDVSLDSGLSPELLSSLAQQLRFDYALIPLAQDVKGETALELRLLSPIQQRLIALVPALVPQTSFEPRVAVAPPVSRPQAAPAPQLAPESRPIFKPRPQTASQPAPVQWNLASAMTELYQVKGLVRGFDGGDVDGDGQAEVVTATKSSVSLYRLQGDQLGLVDTFKTRRQGQLLSVQLLRLGGPSAVGIVVNWQAPAPEGMDSFVLALRGQQLELLQDHMTTILLAVDTDGDGIKEGLWGQSFDEQSFFDTAFTRQYVTVDGSLRPGESIALPATFRATGAALAQLQAQGPRELVFVDKNRQIRIARGKQQLWKSRDRVGGGYTYGELEQIISRDAQRESFFFEPIPATVDVDGDGIEEVLMARNAANLGFAPDLNQFSGGDVVLLRAEFHGFTVSSVSPQFDGVVSGIAVLGGNTPGILVAVSKSKNVLNPGGETKLFLSRFQ